MQHKAAALQRDGSCAVVNAGDRSPHEVPRSREDAIPRRHGPSTPSCSWSPTPTRRDPSGGWRCHPAPRGARSTACRVSQSSHRSGRWAREPCRNHRDERRPCGDLMVVRRSSPDGQRGDLLPPLRGSGAGHSWGCCDSQVVKQPLQSIAEIPHHWMPMSSWRGASTSWPIGRSRTGLRIAISTKCPTLPQINAELDPLAELFYSITARTDDPSRSNCVVDVATSDEDGSLPSRREPAYPRKTPPQ